ncbi:hypothetical protein [uncultured Kiloniella sp.]|uniref:hypothetical protein n=1 Tax=uncultured Kiloniella sp. TaxID=1133091 RepID=UPI00260D4C1D|nr:hypothetical protein [uncultured Kiloniella sp.]
MAHRTPAELPDEHQLYVPAGHQTYKPITDSLFQELFPSSEFPNQEFAIIEEFDTSTD